MLYWFCILAISIITMAYVFYNYGAIKKMDEGTEEMKELSGIIRSGADTFMKTEFKYVLIVVAVLAVIFTTLVEVTSGITLLIGAAMSSTVCILGMRSATYANVRTTNRAKETLSIGETVKVALLGGSISGLSVQAMGLMGLILILIIWNGISADATSQGLLTGLPCNPTITRITTYSLGCSIVAMFNRVAGGNYTKAADISADILGKIRHDLPEDDSRVPNTIADFIGDNVNDIAGNCSDLLESFVATVSASLMIGVILYQRHSAAAVEGLEAAFRKIPLGNKPCKRRDTDQRKPCHRKAKQRQRHRTPDSLQLLNTGFSGLADKCACAEEEAYLRHRMKYRLQNCPGKASCIHQHKAKDYIAYLRNCRIGKTFFENFFNTFRIL